MAQLMMRVPMLLALLTGLIVPFAFAPYGHWYLMPLAFICINALILFSKTPAQLGFCFGLGWFGHGINWVHVSLSTFGGIPLIASIALMALLVAYLSLYPALAAHLIARWPSSKNGKGHLLLWLPACWLLSEWLRGWMLTGFPWLQFGYSQTHSPLSPLAPIIGVDGITFVLMLLSAMLLLTLLRLKRAMSTVQRLWPALLAVILPIALSPLKGHLWTQAQAPINVGLVQGNVDLTQKWLPENLLPTLNTYYQQSLNLHDADVIVWPETAIAAFEYNVVNLLHQLDDDLGSKQQALITGVIAHQLETQAFYNAMLGLGYQGEKAQHTQSSDTENSEAQGGYYFEHPNRYYKQQLLPIGEFVPFEKLLRPLAPLFNLPMSSFSRGSNTQPNIVLHDLAWVSAICYEIAFGELLRQQMSPSSNAIVTVSNDGWFGRSIGPYQHLEMAQMRALEFDRPVIRATNTGHSALIDRHGNLSLSLPAYELASDSANIVPTQGTTPYQRWGTWPLVIWLIFVFIVAFTLRKRQAKGALAQCQRA